MHNSTRNGSENAGKTRKRRAKIALGLLAAFLPLQILAMHWPVPPLPPNVRHVWDKVPHFCIYATLASLLVWRIVAQRRARGVSNAVGLVRPLATAFVCIAAYAWIDELTQPWTGRECDPYDWLADVCGAATVIVGAYAWRRWRHADTNAAWMAPSLTLDAAD